MKLIKSILGVCYVTVLFTHTATAQISPLDTNAGESYYYTDHYETLINKPVADVWPFIVDLGSWMAGLKEANETPPVGVEGEVIRLYGDFYIEVVKAIPEKMLLMVNLPGTQQGEATQGIAMITAQETDGKTLVSLFMSRVYYWFQADQNSLRQRRESSNFAKSRQTLYKDKFLGKLKELAEAEK